MLNIFCSNLNISLKQPECAMIVIVLIKVWDIETIVSCFLSSATGIWHCYWEYSSLKGKPDSDVTISDIGFQTDFRVYLQLRQTWLIFSEFSFLIIWAVPLCCQVVNVMNSSVWWKLLTDWYFSTVISLAVIEGIIILVLIFLRNRVRIAIALLKEGSK